MKIILILMLNISLLLASQFDFLELDEGDIVLKARGYGKTPKEAKLNALQELIFIVKSDIKTSLEVTQESRNNSYNEKTKSKIKIDSKSFFKGVHYSDIKKMNNHYEVDALLTQKALQSTFDFIIQEANQPLENMSVHEKRELLEKILFLKSLYPYSKELKTINKHKIDVIENSLRKDLNFAKLIVESNIKNAEIVIRNQTYKTGQSIYLKEGKYNYVLKAHDYFDEHGSFYAKTGENIFVKKELIKKSHTRKSLSLDIEGGFNITKDIKLLLLHYDVDVSPYKKNSVLHYRFKKVKIAEIGSVKLYKLSLILQLYNNGQVVKIKKAILKKVPESQLSDKAVILAKVLTKKMIQELP